MGYSTRGEDQESASLWTILRGCLSHQAHTPLHLSSHGAAFPHPTSSWALAPCAHNRSTERGWQRLSSFWKWHRILPSQKAAASHPTGGFLVTPVKKKPKPGMVHRRGKPLPGCVPLTRAIILTWSSVLTLCFRAFGFLMSINSVDFGGLLRWRVTLSTSYNFFSYLS